ACWPIAADPAACCASSPPEERCMTYECLLYEVKDGIATLTLNRPDRLNALGGTLRDDLFDAVTRSAADPAVRVMVVTGAGKGFCSGGDVKAMGEAKAGQRERPLIE